MAKVCEPFYGKKCEEFQGGQCTGNQYILRYLVTGINANLGELEWTHTFANLGNFNNFGAILGRIDCITQAFFPNPNDPFFIKYPIYSPTRVFLSIYLFNQGRATPFQLSFPSQSFRVPIAAKFIEVVNITQNGNDPCGSSDPASKDKCKCTDGDQQITCNSAKGGICCIGKPKLIQLCRALK